VRSGPVLVALLLALGAGAPPPASAAPSLQVKARTELRLRPIRKAPAGYVISGQLVDRISGAGLAGERVELTIGGRRASAITGADGGFALEVDAPAGRQDLVVRSAATEHLDAAELHLPDVDVSKNPFDLRVAALPEPGGARIEVAAEVAGVPVALPVELLVGPADAAAERLRPVATVTAGTPHRLGRADAGGPGRRRVRARFAGDALHNPAFADATVELATSTTTTLRLRAHTVAYEDDVVATGEVRDEDGQGIARAPVALLAGGRRIAQAVTGRDGSYRLRVEASGLGPGRAHLAVAFEPTEGWLRPSSSAVVELSIDEPQPVPVAYTIAAFALTALVAGGFFAARSRPWQRLRRPVAEAGERAPGEAPDEPRAGLVPARASLVSTLRRPADHGLTGVVRDAVRHRPLAGAHLVAVRGEARQRAETAGDGSFALEDLAPGEWQIEVARTGHVTERFTATIPHRGELRGARVDLMPVRERIFTLYKRAALPVLPDPGRWGIWSPRQIIDHVRAAQPRTPALAALTDFVEAAYFAADQPGEEVLPEAAAQVDAALREQGGFRV
jgi:hypothetical protein